mmetsp:Transcript_28819/g.45187  ORF Transcript_28819/g.45187 Transcript_28819/m.45187 type:complete len:150 (+) Transcript_28819:222-671(+)|eukprot:CAMPEP_0184294760 /NCGR_PEP_ID=MMETSP1049-20130417/5865_1 /TAXON_ID=77928 /ORGANISM="Proteomonas sulcata, Strain CCMP704" /LENGTH=149 /DNA_ID=CAMNT_0026603149 /DNA_START=213 /DNA_END=662 /DNA_ORIENTATION=-
MAEDRGILYTWLRAPPSALESPAWALSADTGILSSYTEGCRGVGECERGGAPAARTAVSVRKFYFRKGWGPSPLLVVAFSPRACSASGLLTWRLSVGEMFQLLTFGDYVNTINTWAEPHNANGVTPNTVIDSNDEPPANNQQRMSQRGY